MSIAIGLPPSKEASFDLPYYAQDVFMAIKNIGLRNRPYRIIISEDMVMRITLATPVTMFSWGENIYINLVQLQTGHTLLNIKSQSKFGWID